MTKLLVNMFGPTSHNRIVAAEIRICFIVRVSKYGSDDGGGGCDNKVGGDSGKAGSGGGGDNDDGSYEGGGGRGDSCEGSLVACGLFGRQ